MVIIVKHYRKSKENGLRLDRSKSSDELEGSDLITVKSHHSQKIKIKGKRAKIHSKGTKGAAQGPNRNYHWPSDLRSNGLSLKVHDKVTGNTNT